MRDTKQVIVLRKDLNMRKGKMVAQGSHASLAVFFNRIKNETKDNIDISVTPEMLNWIDTSFTKICVGVDSEKELLETYQKAKDAGIPCSLIKDAGHTEFNGVPTFTAVGIGPHTSEEIDKITGTLKLL